MDVNLFTFTLSSSPCKTKKKTSCFRSFKTHFLVIPVGIFTDNWRHMNMYMKNVDGEKDSLQKLKDEPMPVPSKEEETKLSLRKWHCIKLWCAVRCYNFRISLCQRKGTKIKVLTFHQVMLFSMMLLFQNKHMSKERHQKEGFELKSPWNISIWVCMQKN